MGAAADEAAHELAHRIEPVLVPDTAVAVLQLFADRPQARVLLPGEEMAHRKMLEQNKNKSNVGNYRLKTSSLTDG
jgi:hypothetical protein